MTTWKLVPEIIKGITGKDKYLTPPHITLEDAADKRDFDQSLKTTDSPSFIEVFLTDPIIGDEQAVTKKYVDDFVNTNPFNAQLNLKHGSQTIDMPIGSPYYINSIKGSTKINIFGRAGNCESLTGFSFPDATGSLDTINKKYGTSSIKVTNVGGINGNMYTTNYSPIDNTKHYIVLADIMNVDCTSIKIFAIKSTLQVISQGSSTSNTRFTTLYAKVKPSDFAGGTDLTMFIQGTISSVGQSFNVDGMRIYEISADMYTSIDTMSIEQIATAFPFVSDMQALSNTYVIKQGDNLIPPLSEAAIDEHATILGPYRLKLTSTAASQNSSSGKFDVVPNTQYVLSGKIDGEVYGGGYLVTMWIDSDGYAIGFSDNIPTGETSLVITSPSNAVQASVIFAVGTTTGTYTFYDVIMSVGNKIKPFVPKREQVLYIPETWCSNVDGSIYDELYRKGDEFWKLSKFRMMDLDGRLNWSLHSTYDGFKVVQVVIPNGDISEPRVVKHDGKVLSYAVASAAQDIVGKITWELGTGALIISVSNADSGWGNSYDPTIPEIQAYFYGWRMTTIESWNTTIDQFNGTGTRGWVRIYSGWGTQFGSSGIVTGSGSAVLPTRMNYPRYTPYKVQHRLARPTETQIFPEGFITLDEGMNQIESGNGLILREKTAVQLASGNYYINGTGRPLRYRAKHIKSIYNGQMEEFELFRLRGVASDVGQYVVTSSDTVNGYDQNVIYTATYTALDRYSISTLITSISGEYPTNLKTIVDALSRSQAYISTVVDELKRRRSTPTIGAVAKEVMITSATDTVLLARYKDSPVGNYLIGTYFRVASGTPTVGIYLEYTDGGGAQNTVIINQSFAVGSYSMVPVFINTANPGDIKIKVTVSLANAVYVSASIVEVG